MSRRTWIKSTAVILTAAIFALGLNRAEASLAPATMQASDAVRAHDIKTVQMFLEQKEVSQHLAGLHLNSSEINSRLNNLSDRELHDVATRIDQQHPAGDAVVGVLVIVILVLLIIYLFKRV